MVIAVDAVGGDFYPENPIAGALLALKEEKNLSILFVGPSDVIEKELSKVDEPYDKSRVEILHASEIISMDDTASSALKYKQQSSITLGLKAHKTGKCDAFVSAGHTGALLAASTVLLGKLNGVIRPTIAAIYPTLKGVRLLIDAGANLELKSEMYEQFAKMGAVFASEVMGIDNPKVGLINIGEEPEKGPEIIRAAYNNLSALDNFVGNIEGKDILYGKADIFLTDGFTGNVILKFGESLPGILQILFETHLSEMKESKEVQQKLFTILSRAMHTFDYEHVGGVPFLGVDGISLVGHGGSSPAAIKSMILNALQCYTHSVNEKIVASLNKN